jgi:hypothetical protein
VEPPGALPAGARLLPAGADVCRAAGGDGLPTAVSSAVCAGMPAGGVASDASICDASADVIRGRGALQRVPGADDDAAAVDVRPTGILCRA